MIKIFYANSLFKELSRIYHSKTLELSFICCKQPEQRVSDGSCERGLGGMEGGREGGT